jgi:uncharacterized protein YbbC (DUF1343 family)
LSAVRTGLDRLVAEEPELSRLVRGRRIGLLAHAASVDARLRPAQTVLHEAGAQIAALFGPEHGFEGAAQDMVGVGSDSGATVPVYSLYGDSFEELSPDPAWLAGLDAVVIDLQDVGTRFYTYVWTAALMLKACLAAGVEVIALDRPNPLGGLEVEGAPQEEAYLSFVGLYPISVRHGLTLAEILRWVCRADALDAAGLRIVPMKGWQRAMSWAQTGLPWVMPSPNMPSLDTATVYPGGCLIEGTRLSEGRGTTRPFEIWGAPGLDTRPLLRLRLPGATLRPLGFAPTFQKHGGESCNGVQVHVTDRDAFRPYESYLRMLAAVLEQLPEEARWRTEPYEFVSDPLAIDLLTGRSDFRVAVDSRSSIEPLIELEQAGAARFDAERKEILLY